MSNKPIAEMTKQEVVDEYYELRKKQMGLRLQLSNLVDNPSLYIAARMYKTDITEEQAEAMLEDSKQQLRDTLLKVSNRVEMLDATGYVWHYM